MREKSGGRYFLLAHGDATFAVPDGTHMADFACRMLEESAGLKAEAARNVSAALARAALLRRPGGLDGFALCADYCFNTGPFLSPAKFGEFVTPYLTELTRGYRDLGYYVIKHRDGNIMPIFDQWVQTGPQTLHSLDPQGGVDLAEIKRLHGHELCLIGNLHCGLMDNGTPEEIAAMPLAPCETACRAALMYALYQQLDL